MTIKTALISVSDKTGIAELASSLARQGIRILSTGGTARLLKEHGVPVVSVSEHTGSPEILDGRVKTLHPRIHAGILARLDLPEHRHTLEEMGIPPIGVVVVNLYPFVETIGRAGVTQEEAIEQIDIGGPTLIRAAAKNHLHVAVVVDPRDYSTVASAIASPDGVSMATRRSLAQKAFRHTSNYDSAIASYLSSGLKRERPECGDLPQADAPASSLPGEWSIHLELESTLRYGENPHQAAGLYRDAGVPKTGLVAARQLQGRQLSFNNYLDLQAASELCAEFDSCACAIMKHNNPCGVALGSTLLDAYRSALECDPVSAFGSVIAVNRTIDGAAASEMSQLFIEALIAPGFDEQARGIFSGKPNLRLLEAPEERGAMGWDLRRLRGGWLAQAPDLEDAEAASLRCVTRRQPKGGEMEDLLFAWKVCKHVKSNAIVLARQGRAFGVGAGQMSRVDSVRLAIERSRQPTQGSALASDAFFPFRDAVDSAAQAGVRAVIQPGGSKRDEEVIQAADQHGMAMVFTGMRHFRH